MPVGVSTCYPGLYEAPVEILCAPSLACSRSVWLPSALRAAGEGGRGGRHAQIAVLKVAVNEMMVMETYEVQTCAAAVAVVTAAATQIIKILVRLNPYYDLENGYRVTPFTTSVHFSVDEIGALLLKSTNCTLAPTSTLSFEDRHKLTRILLHLHSGGLGALDGAAPPYVQLMSDIDRWRSPSSACSPSTTVGPAAAGTVILTPPCASR